jgi:hypothetical protein
MKYSRRGFIANALAGAVTIITGRKINFDPILGKLTETTNPTIEQMVFAIKASKGNIQNAAVLLGCSRVVVKEYIARFPAVRKEYLDQHEMWSSTVPREKLMEAIDQGQPWAIMFYYRECLPRYVSGI